MRWVLLLVPVIALAADPEFRVERVPVSGGAELLTVFATTPDDADQVPLLSLLRDTLGDSDPSNDRLRSLWILTSANPSPLQRAAGAIPFFYWRPNLGKSASKTPGPVLDLANTSSVVWSSLAQSLTQVMAVDSMGAMIRASTRRYRTNLSDRRRVHLIEGLSVLSSLEDLPEVRAILSEPELQEIQARLMLAGQTLGGLVTAEKLPDAYFKRRGQTQEMLGHNWELLRQSAEANGLYFDPLGVGGTSTHALVWIARDEAVSGRPFNGRFLDIQNPYGDERVQQWWGVTIRRSYDSSGREVAPGTPGATERELIPLALYGLDYPKVPLLLVDFRNALSPKRREMLGRAASDVVSGVLGISRWGNWPYMAGSMGWNFLRARRGVPNNGAQRLEAYAGVRRWLALDDSLDPALRAELQQRLEMMGVNPLEESVFDENKFARKRYAALLAYAADPKGLPARLQKDRAAELTAYDHGALARTGLKLAHFATLGIYDHHEPEQNAALVAVLDKERRASGEIRFLETVLKSSSNPELVWDMDEVLRSLDSLAAEGFPSRSANAVEKILAQTTEEGTRALFQRALYNLHAATD